MSTSTDIIVIGAGIAGASVAAELAREGAKVVLLEREDQPGYHSTGRSAALYIETYGPEQIRRLTRAGREWFLNPPAGLTETPLMTPSGVILLGYEGEADLLKGAVSEAELTGSKVDVLSPEECIKRAPILKRDRLIGGVFDASALAMDASGIHQARLKQLKRHGGSLVCKAEVTGLKHGQGKWTVTTKAGDFTAPTVVNAAGAWADVVAGMAGVKKVGLTPKRRTGVIVPLPAGQSPVGWPCVGDIKSTWYFKPEGGKLMVSPADETPVEPQDIQPDEMDVALAIDRFMQATTVNVKRPERTWAGLRSFVADKELVVGFAPDADGFFWLAAQGGYGIQSSAGVSVLASALVQKKPMPKALEPFGVKPEAMAPDRPGLKKAKH
ncbi:MAG: FAD-binding oxidoreductase [Hyphomicrobiaceae bacterium]